MDKNPRIFLFGLLAIVILLFYRAWIEDHTVVTTPPPVAQTQANLNGATSPTDNNDLPSVTASGLDSPTVTSPTTVRETRPNDLPKADTAVQPELISDRYITVKTDVLHLRIDRLGGVITSAQLPQYPVSIDEPETPISLIKTSDDELFVAQSGITPANPRERAEGLPLFTSDATHYELEDTAEKLSVRLTWLNDKGLRFVKTLQFTRNNYLFQIDQEVFNGTDDVWEGAFYSQFKRIPPIEKGGGLTRARSFTGAAFSTEEKRYQKVKFDEIREGKFSELETRSGWVAMLQHYFLAVWIPPQNRSFTVYSNYQAAGNNHFVGFKTPLMRVEQGGIEKFDQQLYVGPKTQDTLKTIAPALERTVDYGYLFFIAEPLFWLLKNINRLIGNWGWSIIILTTLIKLAFFKLSEKSYRSMANMRRMSPKLKALKERYADDKVRLNQETMALYKKEKINPLGGCLPIVIQMPVFISLYWMLLETVELRQAPFMFWIQDLSIRDPFFILPIIMGASMLLQQRLNPAPMDATQQKVMMIMPIVFTGMFLFFPAGLVLYWVVNNILSIAQQWYITKQVAPKS